MLVVGFYDFGVKNGRLYLKNSIVNLELNIAAVFL